MVALCLMKQFNKTWTCYLAALLLVLLSLPRAGFRYFRPRCFLLPYVHEREASKCRVVAGYIMLVSMGGAWLRRASRMYPPMLPSATRWKKNRCSKLFSEMERSAGRRSRSAAKRPSSEPRDRRQYSSRQENICKAKRINITIIPPARNHLSNLSVFVSFSLTCCHGLW